MLIELGKYIVYALITSFGLYFIKTGGSIFALSFITGLLLYGLGFIIWLYLLRAHPISIAFPLAAALVIISTQLIGFFLLKESLTVDRITGIIFILAGVFLVYRGFFNG